jgi:DNA gyrase/topoisomerase IV subunit A
MNITKPITVNDLNRDFLMKLIQNGPDLYPGAKILEKKNISEICKIHIILNTANIEYNMLRGRRVIIHFDRLVMVIIYLLQKYKY